MVSRYSDVLLRLRVERGGVRLEEEADVLAQQRIVLERGLLRRADGRDGDALIRVQPLLLQRIERARVDEPLRIGRVLDDAAVREHRGLEDAAERAGHIQRAAEERRFSGRFERCTCASSIARLRSLHWNAFATTPMCWSGESRSR